MMYLKNREYTTSEKFLYKLCYDDNVIKIVRLMDVFLIAFISSYVIAEYELYVEWLKVYYE
ncbi:hypothetical protein ACH5BK_06040 [Arcobacter sp. YIC-80]|uniref:hypothetical protein n=1 Tax=Arcobacter sp. YIC-80 TaxID=3376683 RepID=UPI0038517611